MFNLKKTTDLIILNALKERFKTCDNAVRIESARDALLFATKCTLTEGELLDFFETKIEAVKDTAGEESIRDHGLYRTLIFTPVLSPVCELFFGALVALDRENSLKLRPSI